MASIALPHSQIIGKALLFDGTSGTGASLVGKCYDFASAYKQCPLVNFDADVGVTAVQGLQEDTLFYRIHALPFGAVGSARCQRRGDK